MRTRLVILFSLVVAIFGGASSHAVELLGQPQITAATTHVTVSWKTDVECGTRLQYGSNAAQLTQKAEGPVSSDHQVRLEGLAPGTTYHYSLGSARARLATGTFATLGGAPPAATPPPPPPPSLVRKVLNAITPERKAAAVVTAPAVPPTSRTWGNVSTLQDHFDRHGRDFNSKSPADYAAQAWLFLQRAQAENLPMKMDDTDRTLRIYDSHTGTFAAYNGAGRTKTFFKPGSPGYWQRQPGRPVKTAAELPNTFRQP